MSASDRLAAVSVWLYRVLPYTTSYIALSGDRLRLALKTRQSLLDLHVGAQETFTVGRSWFWKRLTIRTTGGVEYSVRGLRHASAVLLREGVLKAARGYAAEQAPGLVRLDDHLRRILSGDTFVRSPVLDAVQTKALGPQVSAAVELGGGVGRPGPDNPPAARGHQCV